MTGVTLTLGSVTFANFEIPQSINFGGQQRLSVKKLVGGARQVDVLGPDPDDIAWSGRFRGPSAVQRAQALDAMRIAGQQVTLSWGSFTYPVVIAEFRADFLKSYEIPYKITCVITVGDAVKTATAGVTSLVGGALSSLGSLVGSIEGAVTGALAPLTGPLAEISSNIGDATSFLSTAGSLTGLSLGQTSSLTSFLTNAQSGIGGAISIANGNIAVGANQIGGVIPSNPQASAVSLTTNIANLGNLTNLLNMRGLTGVTLNNVQQAAAST